MQRVFGCGAHRLGTAVFVSAMIIGVAEVSTGQPARLDQRLADRGRELTRLMYAGELEPIWDRSSQELKTTLESINAMRDVHVQLFAVLGKETSLIGERTVTQTDLDIYVRTVTFEQTGTDQFAVQWAFDRQGAIQGFTIRAAAP